MHKEVVSEAAIKQEDYLKEGFKGKDQLPKLREYVPHIPYPACLNQTFNEYNGKFHKLYDRLHLSLPFFVVMSQMSKHAKCLKKLLYTKVKLKEVSKEVLIQEYSTVVHEKVVQKLKDPGVLQFPVSLEIAPLIELY